MMRVCWQVAPIVCAVMCSAHATAQIRFWDARYANAEARALAMDAFSSASDAYVAGKVFVSPGNTDFLTAKYNAAGCLTWAVTYNGSGNGSDEAYAIAIDAQHHVYVTGSSRGPGFNFLDFLTIKYEWNGQRSSSWPDQGDGVGVRRYNHAPGNADDVAYAIATDAAGNVYVTGSSFEPGNGLDYLTLVYGPTGALLWSRRYDGPATGGLSPDVARAIALNLESGQYYLYVTGESSGAGTGADYATIKYDAVTGNTVWPASGANNRGQVFHAGAVRYNSSGNGDDYATALAVGQGGIYVTGRSAVQPLGPHDYATVRYSPNGNAVWPASGSSNGQTFHNGAVRFNGPANGDDRANGLALWGGTVYVTGTSEGPGTSYDYATVKYDALGNPSTTWPSTGGSGIGVRRYNGLGNSWDEATAIAMDYSEQLYVTGRSIGLGSGLDYATLYYDGTTGSLSWSDRYTPSGSSPDDARALVVRGKCAGAWLTGASSGAAATLRYTPADPCDVNCDGLVNFADINPFLEIFNGGQGCGPCAGDVNGDGFVDAADIPGFICCLVK